MAFPLPAPTHLYCDVQRHVHHRRSVPFVDSLPFQVNIKNINASDGVDGLLVLSNDCRGRKGFGLIEAKLQHHIEHEDRRVKELTEAILYDFVPSAMDAMLVPTDDPASELHVDRCRVSFKEKEWVLV